MAIHHNRKIFRVFASFFMVLESLLVIGSVAHAQNDMAFGASYSIVSKGGDNWTLGFEDNSVTTDSVEARFCSARQVGIESAQLWMPSMGHGTSPVTLAPVGNGCTAVRDMNFVMQGVWELRIRVVSGDQGTFRFKVRS